MKKILVIDDDEKNRKLFGEALRNAGYEVVTAEDGTEGVYMARKETPDLILLDLAMPDVDGIEVCKRIKEVEKIRHIPIIMVSAMNDTPLIEIARKAGVADYVTKPFKVAELLAKIKGLL